MLWHLKKICISQWTYLIVHKHMYQQQQAVIKWGQTIQWPKGQSLKIPVEVIKRCNQMRTDNTMAKRTTMIYKTLHRKLQIWATWTQLKTGGELRCSRRVSSSCSTWGTRHVTLVTNLVISTWMRKGSDLWQAEYIHDHLWHRYSVAVNQVMVALDYINKIIKLIII